MAVASSFVAVLMLSGSSVAAGPAVTTVSAPFKGTVSSPTNSGASSGCGVGSNVVAAHWDAKHGLARMDESATAKTCPASTVGYGGSGANAYGEIAIGVPVHIGNGTHSVRVDMTFSVWGIDALKAVGACPAPVINPYGYGSSYCYAQASSYVNTYVYLVDQTSGSYYYPNNYWGGLRNYTSQTNDEYCYSGSCTYTNSTSVTVGGMVHNTSSWWINSTSFVKTDKYELVLDVSAGTDAGIYGYGSGNVVGTMDMAKNGHFARLVLVTIK